MKKEIRVSIFIFIIINVMFMQKCYAIPGAAGGAAGDNKIQEVTTNVIDNSPNIGDANHTSTGGATNVIDNSQNIPGAGGDASGYHKDHTKSEDDKDKSNNSNNSNNGNKIYQQPSRYNTTNDGNSSLDDMINDADSFIESGDKLTYNETALQNFSKSLYNIAMSVGVIVAVGVGLIIGIRLMSESIERKVEANKLLVPYVVGCVIVFGGFTIWKLVIEILQKV